MMPRVLAAQFLFVVRDCVVAVDRLQPVAALLSPTGVLLDVTSWAEHSNAPEEWVWPNRRVAAGEDTVVVQDLPDGRAVGLVVGAGRFDRIDAADAEQTWRHPRLFGAVPTTFGAWTFEGQRTNDRWWSWVERDGHRWTAGEGSFVARAVTEEWAVTAIRRAPVRPWAFRPQHELVLLTAGATGLVPAQIEPIDVAPHCWPRRPDADQAFRDYLPWSENLARVIQNEGGRDVRLVVEAPNVDIHFTQHGFRYLLHDEPLDELGRPAGLRFWDTGIDDWSAMPSSLIVS